MKGIIAIAVGCCAVFSVAAAPTTKPSTAPARAAVDRDSQIVENTKFKYRLAVPKAWKQVEKSDTQVRYSLPATKSDVMLDTGSYEFYSAAPCHPNASLQEEVDSIKQAWQQNQKDVKFTKDEAFTLAGEPAWLLILERPYTVTPIPNPKAKAPPKPMTRKTRQMEVIALHGGNSFQSTFSIDAAAFDAKSVSVKRILASLEWTDQ